MYTGVCCTDEIYAHRSMPSRRGATDDLCHSARQSRRIVAFISGFLIRNYKDQYTALQVGTGDSSATIPFYESCGFCRHHLVKKYLLSTTTTTSVNAGCGWWIRCACKGNCKHAQWTLRTNRTAVTGMTDVALRQRSDRSIAGVRTGIDRQRCIV